MFTGIFDEKIGSKILGVGLVFSNNSEFPKHFTCASLITSPLTACMQTHSLLAGNDKDRVQNFQVGLLGYVVGDPLTVERHTLRVVEDQNSDVGDRRFFFFVKRFKEWQIATEKPKTKKILNT